MSNNNRLLAGLLVIIILLNTRTAYASERKSIEKELKKYSSTVKFDIEQNINKGSDISQLHIELSNNLGIVNGTRTLAIKDAYGIVKEDFSYNTDEISYDYIQNSESSMLDDSRIVDIIPWFIKTDGEDKRTNNGLDVFKIFMFGDKFKKSKRFYKKNGIVKYKYKDKEQKIEYKFYKKQLQEVHWSGKSLLGKTHEIWIKGIGWNR